MNGLWEKANEVSEVGYKVHSAAMVVELIATSITDNAESGAAWAAVDMLENLSDRLDRLASEIMALNRQHEEPEIKLKKKKK
jgi:thiamine biosynthesis lipoprotein ApbE